MGHVDPQDAAAQTVQEQAAQMVAANSVAQDLRSAVGNRALAEIARSAPRHERLLASLLTGDRVRLGRTLARQSHATASETRPGPQVTVHGATRLTDALIDPLHQVPSRYANQFYFRHDWAPAHILLEAEGAQGHGVSWEPSLMGQQPNPTLGRTDGPGRYLLTRPSDPAGVFVSCRRAGQSQAVIIWFVAGSLDIHNRGLPASNNPGWPTTRAYLLDEYVHHGTFGYNTLGLEQWADTTANAAARRYGALVELVGTVTPPETAPFIFQARRVVNSTVTGVDAHGRELPDARGPRPRVLRPGGEDSTPPDMQSHNAAGVIFDYDAPGSSMTAANERGDVHHWNVLWEQMLYIGGVSPSGDPAMALHVTDRDTGIVTTTPGTSYFADSQRLHKDVSPVMRWQANYTVECLSPRGTLVPEIRLNGSVARA